MRESNDEYINGKLVNGFDYDLQVWVVNGIIQDAGSGAKDHPEWVGQPLWYIKHIMDESLSYKDRFCQYEGR